MYHIIVLINGNGYGLRAVAVFLIRGVLRVFWLPGICFRMLLLRLMKYRIKQPEKRVERLEGEGHNSVAKMLIAIETKNAQSNTNPCKYEKINCELESRDHIVCIATNQTYS